MAPIHELLLARREVHRRYRSVWQPEGDPLPVRAQGVRPRVRARLRLSFDQVSGCISEHQMKRSGSLTILLGGYEMVPVCGVVHIDEDLAGGSSQSPQPSERRGVPERDDATVDRCDLA